jgi:hypothetical protein
MSTPKSDSDDKLNVLKLEVKELISKLRSCRSDISKNQKQKDSLKEKFEAIIESENAAASRLMKAIEVEEDLEDDLIGKQIDIAKLETEKVLNKEFSKKLKEKDDEISSLKKTIKKLEEDNTKISTKLEDTAKLLKQTQDAVAYGKYPDSGVYLLRLGTSENLKDIFTIPVDKISKTYYIYKYGRSNDIINRNDQHNLCLGKLIGKDLEMIHSKKVSHYDCSSAETKIKKFFQDKSYTFISEDSKGNKYKELICICNKDLADIKKFYDSLGC